MAEKLRKYFQFYNSEEEFFSKPLTRKQVIDEIDRSLNFIQEGGYVTYEINPILLTEHQAKTGDFHHDN